MSDMRLADRRIRCYTTGDEVKRWDEIDEDDKPEFVDLTEEGVMAMFKDMIKVSDEGEIEPEPLGSEYDFHELYGPEYYAEKFPGFDDETYYIMAKAHKLMNEERLLLEDVD